jgi:hypothetical protein
MDIMFNPVVAGVGLVRRGRTRQMVRLVPLVVLEQTLFLLGGWPQALGTMLPVLFGLVVAVRAGLTTQILLLPHLVLVAGGSVLVVLVKTG